MTQHFFQCRQPFKPARSTARYCSSACRKAAFKNRLSVPELPRPILSVPAPPEPVAVLSSGHSEAIAPLRWRPPLGDRDIRDIKGPAPGMEMDMPDLPDFLDRRGGSTIVLKEAA